MTYTHSSSIDRGAAQEGRLLARPSTVSTAGKKGLQALHLDSRRDAWLYVPDTYSPHTPAPLVLALHGAGGEGCGHLGNLREVADRRGLILLAPTSRQSTWDMLYGEYGPDVEFIDAALERVFSSYAIDPMRLAVEGFSDGASYALSIGLTDGDLFTHILAFSPGFMAPATQRGKPHIFISHGTSDTVLNIDRCSRRIVPQLERAGYDVRYVEFSSGHAVPADIVNAGTAWFLEGE